MRLSAAGLAAIAAREGCKLAAYQDSAGVWTIGVGHTRDVYRGEKITQTAAMQLLAMDSAYTAQQVDAAVQGIATTQDQFDAMVSLAFNIGVAAFRSSSVLAHHRGGLTMTAADNFLLWDKAHIDGVLIEVPGLLARRQAERAQYLAH